MLGLHVCVYAQLPPPFLYNFFECAGTQAQILSSHPYLELSPVPHSFAITLPRKGYCAIVGDNEINWSVRTGSEMVRGKARQGRGTHWEQEAVVIGPVGHKEASQVYLFL